MRDYIICLANVLGTPPPAAAATAKAKAAAPTTKKRHHLEVEMDPVKLCTRLVGGNINKEGEDPVLKPDSDYPEWLWKLRTDREPVKLEDLEYNSAEYWERLKEMDKLRRMRMRAVQYKYKDF